MWLVLKLMLGAVLQSVALRRSNSAPAWTAPSPRRRSAAACLAAGERGGLAGVGGLHPHPPPLDGAVGDPCAPQLRPNAHRLLPGELLQEGEGRPGVGLHGPAGHRDVTGFA